ncbi:MAG: putative RecB family exonuclease [Actinomycetota bacterium]|jgi:putative RecB family exonuclease
MSLPLPSGLSPSKVSSFKDCALAFRFSAIDHLPEPPAPYLAKGTLVHRALELLFTEAPADRTLDAALEHLQTAHTEVLADPENDGLVLEDEGVWLSEAESLVRNYFQLEDPTGVNAIGLELRLDAQIGSLRLRGIIDRLDLDDNGDLTVVDYKTGGAPGVNWEGKRLGGVQFYAYLCEQLFGRRPVAVRLLHLKEPLSITSVPTDQSIRGLTTRTQAIWAAIERACENDDFRPRPSRLCDFCSFREWCPAWGGNPADAPRPELAKSA